MPSILTDILPLTLINPGIILIITGFISVFLKNNKQRLIISLTGLATALFILLGLPEGERLLTFVFLDFEIILLEVDAISRNIALVFVAFGTSAFIFSYNFSTRKEFPLVNFYLAFSFIILFVGDFISFFIAWELITLSAFFLIYDIYDGVRQHTAQYYILMHVFGGLMLLWGIILHVTESGSVILAVPERGMIFFLLSIGIKLAFVGVHTWLPRTYANIPLHISVILSAYTSKIGVYGLYRLIEIDNILIAYFGVFNAILGVALAITHSDIRKILSYSIVSQIGYMIVGIGIGNELGIVGGGFHIVNHILYKGLHFIMAGTIIYSIGHDNLEHLGGLWKKLPLTFVTGLIASLSIAGFPFFNGYLSKTMIKHSTDNQILYYGMIIAGIGTALTFIKVIYFGFIREGDNPEIKKQPLFSMRFSMVFLTIIMMATALLPDQMESLYNISTGINYFSGYEIWSALQPNLIALALFPVVKRAISPHPEKPIEPDFYCNACNYFIEFDDNVSKIHTGDTVRYVTWVLFTLVLLLLNFYVINLF